VSTIRPIYSRNTERIDILLVRIPVLVWSETSHLSTFAKGHQNKNKQPRSEGSTYCWRK
jgi:hypothetical protein